MIKNFAKFVFGLTVVAFTSAAPAGITAAQYIPSDGDSGYGVGDSIFQAAQTFVSNQTGDVEEVQFLLLSNSTIPGSLTATVTDLVAGEPGSTLGSVTVLNPVFPPLSNEEDPDPFWFAFDFNGESIGLQSGTGYAIILSTPDGIGIRGDLPGSYADGKAFITSNSGSTWNGVDGGMTDWGFQVTVVPEPTSAALLGFGGLLVTRRRRCRR